MKKEMRYLVPGDYMADPAVHVFNNRVYIYPSHDWESGIEENDNGDHFNMKDYHVFSTDDIMNGEIKDHGVVLQIEDIPWAGRTERTKKQSRLLKTHNRLKTDK